MSIQRVVSEAQCRSQHHAVALALHLVLRSRGCRLTKVGDVAVSDCAVPDGWDTSADVVAFSYTLPRSLRMMEVKALVVGPDLHVHAVAGDQTVYVQLIVADYIDAAGTLAIEPLQDVVLSRILHRIQPPTPPSGGLAVDPLRDPRDPARGMPIRPLLPRDPFADGDDLVGPHNPVFGPPNAPDRRPWDPAPRFDSFGPDGTGAGPDNDLFEPPQGGRGPYGQRGHGRGPFGF